MVYFVFKNAAENNINSVFIAQSLLLFSLDFILVMKQVGQKLLPRCKGQQNAFV